MAAGLQPNASSSKDVCRAPAAADAVCVVSLSSSRALAFRALTAIKNPGTARFLERSARKLGRTLAAVDFCGAVKESKLFPKWADVRRLKLPARLATRIRNSIVCAAAQKAFKKAVQILNMLRMNLSQQKIEQPRPEVDTFSVLEEISVKRFESGTVRNFPLIEEAFDPATPQFSVARVLDFMAKREFEAATKRQQQKIEWRLNKEAKAREAREDGMSAAQWMKERMIKAAMHGYASTKPANPVVDLRGASAPVEAKRCAQKQLLALGLNFVPVPKREETENMLLKAAAKAADRVMPPMKEAFMEKAASLRKLMPCVRFDNVPEEQRNAIRELQEEAAVAMSDRGRRPVIMEKAAYAQQLETAVKEAVEQDLFQVLSKDEANAQLEKVKKAAVRLKLARADLIPLAGRLHGRPKLQKVDTRLLSEDGKQSQVALMVPLRGLEDKRNATATEGAALLNKALKPLYKREPFLAQRGGLDVVQQLHGLRFTKKPWVCKFDVEKAFWRITREMALEAVAEAYDSAPLSVQQEIARLRKPPLSRSALLDLVRLVYADAVATFLKEDGTEAFVLNKGLGMGSKASVAIENLVLPRIVRRAIASAEAEKGATPVAVHGFGDDYTCVFPDSEKDIAPFQAALNKEIKWERIDPTAQNLARVPAAPENAEWAIPILDAAVILVPEGQQWALHTSVWVKPDDRLYRTNSASCQPPEHLHAPTRSHWDRVARFASSVELAIAAAQRVGELAKKQGLEKEEFLKIVKSRPAKFLALEPVLPHRPNASAEMQPKPALFKEKRETKVPLLCPWFGPKSRELAQKLKALVEEYRGKGAPGGAEATEPTKLRIAWMTGPNLARMLAGNLKASIHPSLETHLVYKIQRRPAQKRPRSPSAEDGARRREADECCGIGQVGARQLYKRIREHSRDISEGKGTYAEHGSYAVWEAGLSKPEILAREKHLGARLAIEARMIKMHGAITGPSCVLHPDWFAPRRSLALPVTMQRRSRQRSGISDYPPSKARDTQCSPSPRCTATAAAATSAQKDDVARPGKITGGGQGSRGSGGRGRWRGRGDRERGAKRAPREEEGYRTAPRARCEICGTPSHKTTDCPLLKACRAAVRAEPEAGGRHASGMDLDTVHGSAPNPGPILRPGQCRECDEMPLGVCVKHFAIGRWHQGTLPPWADEDVTAQLQAFAEAQAFQGGGTKAEYLSNIAVVCGRTVVQVPGDGWCARYAIALGVFGSKAESSFVNAAAIAHAAEMWGVWASNAQRREWLAAQADAERKHPADGLWLEAVAAALAIKIVILHCQYTEGKPRTAYLLGVKGPAIFLTYDDEHYNLAANAKDAAALTAAAAKDEKPRKLEEAALPPGIPRPLRKQMCGKEERQKSYPRPRTPYFRGTTARTPSASSASARSGRSSIASRPSSQSERQPRSFGKEAREEMQQILQRQQRLFQLLN